MMPQASTQAALADGGLRSAFESDERFGSVLSRAIKEELGITVIEFSKCVPIVSPTVEKIMSIPVATIHPTSSIVQATELAARKRSC